MRIITCCMLQLLYRPTNSIASYWSLRFVRIFCLQLLNAKNQIFFRHMSQCRDRVLWFHYHYTVELRIRVSYIECTSNNIVHTRTKCLVVCVFFETFHDISSARELQSNHELTTRKSHARTREVRSHHMKYSNDHNHFNAGFSHSALCNFSLKMCFWFFEITFTGTKVETQDIMMLLKQICVFSVYE